MKKTELLAPAGDLETLKIAVNCGADAVYVSLKDYGARKYAKNFTMEELIEGVKYCHLYDVRIYVTVNTLIHDSEIEGVLEIISKLQTIGVDALIMQDLGLISLVRKRFPNMEIHTSTQAHNCSKECVKFWENTGVTRVVLAREMSIDEIKNIETPLELEVFIHGALCVSYSGQCLISSKMFGRSGNRGECSQVCRFCFDMYNDDKKLNLSNKYLLSMKDLCSANQIKELLDLKISSLKIEGRMKSKYYVGIVTKFYRNLIDKYYNNEPLTYTEEEYKELLTVYNREFTQGFLGNETDVVNPKTCNHQGIVLGKVLETNKKVKVLLLEDLYQEDGVRFSNNEGMICNYIYNEKGLLINSARKGDIIYLDNKINLNEKGLVYKTVNVSINKKVESITRKIKVDMKCTLKVGEPLVITIKCGKNEITKSLGVVEKSINSPITKKQIVERLSKLGNTPFVINKIEIDCDKNVFVPVKVINELRRELVNELIVLRENREVKTDEIAQMICTKDNELTSEISFLVRTEEQINELLAKNVNIYVEDYNLYKKYQNKNVYYRPARSNNDDSLAKNCLITNNGYVNNSYNKSVIDIYMNCYNSLTTAFYSNHAYKIGISPELNNYEIKELVDSYKNNFNSFPNIEVLVYGKLELMIMKYCPIRGLSGSEKCNLCENKNYYLDDRKNNRFKLLKDKFHKVRVMDYQNVNKLSEIDDLKRIGVTNFRIDLLDETKDDLYVILKALKLM